MLLYVIHMHTRILALLITMSESVSNDVTSQSLGGLLVVSSTHHGLERDTLTTCNEHPNIPETLSPIISQNSDGVALNTTAREREEITDSNSGT